MQAAAAAGVHRNTVYDLEKDDEGVTYRVMLKVAATYGVGLGEVFSDDSAPNRVPAEYRPLAEQLAPLQSAQRIAVVRNIASNLSMMRMVYAAEERESSAPIPDNVSVMPERTVPRWTEEFPIDPESFVEKDFDYPLELHALEVEDMEFAAGETGIVSEVVDMAAYTLNAKDVRDATHRVIKVKGDSMAPEFEDGWKLLVDVRKQSPQPGEVVAVYLLDATNEGGIIGYWEPTRDGVQIEKANPSYRPVKLGDPTTWKLVGTVQKVVDAPVKRRKGPKRAK
jgi:SOS-response transcriptional repressor LexA